ncbi:hypothetical protein B0T18DRAFT_392085 [Schizothecium vesticola]|uniref:Uncharacterized protein n=1 Tax=Schizothecium vesticola TaxID=314040 RepID=A0AA40EPW2_9PEZI|nr:hypothetical protein B0T18DRAFT_392085 [Schizothecium vesticola]
MSRVKKGSQDGTKQRIALVEGAMGSARSAFRRLQVRFCTCERPSAFPCPSGPESSCISKPGAADDGTRNLVERAPHVLRWKSKQPTTEGSVNSHWSYSRSQSLVLATRGAPQSLSGLEAADVVGVSSSGSRVSLLAVADEVEGEGADPEDGTDSQWRNAVSSTRAWIGLNTRPGLRSVVISWSPSHDWGCDGIGMGSGKIRGKRLSLVNASEQQAKGGSKISLARGDGEVDSGQNGRKNSYDCRQGQYLRLPGVVSELAISHLTFSRPMALVPARTVTARVFPMCLEQFIVDSVNG